MPGVLSCRSKKARSKTLLLFIWYLLWKPRRWRGLVFPNPWMLWPFQRRKRVRVAFKLHYLTLSALKFSFYIRKFFEQYFKIRGLQYVFWLLFQGLNMYVCMNDEWCGTYYNHFWYLYFPNIMNSPSTYSELIWQTEFLIIYDIINLNLKNIKPWTILLLKDNKQKCQY